MANIEITCLRVLCQNAQNHGFTPVSVEDSEEVTPVTGAAQAIEAASGIDDFITLRFVREDGASFGVLYVPGNGAECLSDYFASAISFGVIQQLMGGVYDRIDVAVERSGGAA